MKVSEVRVDRIEQLATFLLDTVQDEWFDLRRWFKGAKTSGVVLVDADAIDQFEARTCGTAACAMGWAPQVPELAKFIFAKNVDGWLLWFVKEQVGDPYCRPTFKQFNGGYEAACALFGISHNMASFMFSMDDRNRSRKHVARRMLYVVDAFKANEGVLELDYEKELAIRSAVRDTEYALDTGTTPPPAASVRYERLKG